MLLTPELALIAVLVQAFALLTLQSRNKIKSPLRLDCARDFY
jgi:hypothetical protein